MVRYGSQMKKEHFYSFIYYKAFLIVVNLQQRVVEAMMWLMACNPGGFGIYYLTFCGSIVSITILIAVNF